MGKGTMFVTTSVFLGGIMYPSLIRDYTEIVKVLNKTLRLAKRVVLSVRMLDINTGIFTSGF